MSVLPEQDCWMKRPVRSEKSWPVVVAQSTKRACERMDWEDGGEQSSASQGVVLVEVGEELVVGGGGSSLMGLVGIGATGVVVVERRLARCWSRWPLTMAMEGGG